VNPRGFWHLLLSFSILAVGLLVMMYPILCKVRYETLHEIFLHRGMWKQIAFSLVANWIVAPFLMVSISVPVCFVRWPS